MVTRTILMPSIDARELIGRLSSSETHSYYLFTSAFVIPWTYSATTKTDLYVDLQFRDDGQYFQSAKRVALPAGEVFVLEKPLSLGENSLQFNTIIAFQSRWRKADGLILFNGDLFKQELNVTEYAIQLRGLNANAKLRLL